VLFGASEGGPACIRFAADHPDRVAGLILFDSLAKGSSAPDYPHALHAEQYQAWLQQLVSAWGGPAGIETFAPSLAADARARAWWAGLLRAASSPGAIRGVLQGHGSSGVNRDYVLATVKAIEAEGFRDSQLHRLAVMLHDTHPVPLPTEDSDR
jgi:pimeloyl-ACP methyl ester carboxylesterase